MYLSSVQIYPENGIRSHLEEEGIDVSPRRDCIPPASSRPSSRARPLGVPIAAPTPAGLPAVAVSSANSERPPPPPEDAMSGHSPLPALTREEEQSSMSNEMSGALKLLKAPTRKKKDYLSLHAPADAVGEGGEGGASHEDEEASRADAHAGRIMNIERSSNTENIGEGRVALVNSNEQPQSKTIHEIETLEEKNITVEEVLAKEPLTSPLSSDQSKGQFLSSIQTLNSSSNIRGPASLASESPKRHVDIGVKKGLREENEVGQPEGRILSRSPVKQIRGIEDNESFLADITPPIVASQSSPLKYLLHSVDTEERNASNEIPVQQRSAVRISRERKQLSSERQVESELYSEAMPSLEPTSVRDAAAFISDRSVELRAYIEALSNLEAEFIREYGVAALAEIK